MTNLVIAQFNGAQVQFTEEGWINATEIADRFGKRPVDWLKLDSTKEYVSILQEMFPEVKKFHFARKGGDATKQGTWLHPKLAVRFAQWLDVRFAVWCDLQIDSLLRGNHPHIDWKLKRHEASASFKVMTQILQIRRQSDGKSTQPYHYMNEAKLINWIISGEFKGLDREQLTSGELDLLARLEDRNSILIANGKEREERKAELIIFAAQHRKGLCRVA